MRTTIRLPTWSALLLLLLAGAAQATVPAPVQVLSPVQTGAPTVIRFFSQNMSVSGDVAAIGAPHNTGGGSSVAGTAFVFRRTGSSWNYVQALQAPTPALGDGYGYGVTAVANTLLVGAPFGNDGRGALHVYGNNGTSFQLLQSIPAPVDVPVNGWFGLRSDADAGWLAIGAPALSSAGAVYMYRFDNVAESWVFHSKLVSNVVGGGGRFGFALGLRGNQLVVGSPLDDDPSNAVGYAYAFSRTGDGSTAVWTLNQRFRMTADQGSSAPLLFGLSLSLDSTGTRLAVGAPQAGPLAGSGVVGAVFVFERNGNTWTQSARVDSPLGVRGSFGTGVNLQGDLLLAGDPQGSAISAVRGAAVLFRRQGNGSWAPLESWYRSTGATSNYGISVAIAGAQALVGDSTADEPGATDRGLVFVQQRDAMFTDGFE
jgi:hypothetical protein